MKGLLREWGESAWAGTAAFLILAALGLYWTWWMALSGICANGIGTLLLVARRRWFVRPPSPIATPPGIR